jgi:hypothetical protein
MQKLTPFQNDCRAAVDAVLGEFGIETLYETHDAESISEGTRGAFLRTQFARGEDAYDLFIYADEAALNITRTWYAFERHNHPDPEDLVAALVGFLRGCFRGENPVDRQ